MTSLGSPQPERITETANKNPPPQYHENGGLWPYRVDVKWPDLPDRSWVGENQKEDKKQINPIAETPNRLQEILSKMTPGQRYIDSIYYKELKKELDNQLPYLPARSEVKRENCKHALLRIEGPSKNDPAYIVTDVCVLCNKMYQDTDVRDTYYQGRGLGRAEIAKELFTGSVNPPNQKI